MKFPQKIPTILALFLLIAIVGGVSVVTNMVTQTVSLASSSIEPKNVLLTNITNTGFSVTWTTSDPATGTISVKAGSTTQTYFDTRDSEGKLGKYTTHSVSLRDAKPGIHHEIRILSGGKTYLNNGKPYEITTAPTLDVTAGIEPAFGSVINPDNSPAVGALVYLTLEGSQTLSALVTNTGSWLIPLNTIRTQDLASRLEPKDRFEEQIRILNNLGEAGAITDSLNDSPVPLITIGKSYDFRKQQASQPSKSMGSLALSKEIEKPSDVLGDQIDTTKSKKSYPFTITQPDDNASLISNMPLFTGTGVPGKTVTLTIGIKQPTTATITIEKDGLWKYTQTKPLGVGRQSITATSIDNYGKSIAVTHVFDVLKSGTQVLGVATPSATLAPSITPIFTPTPTATLTGQEPPTTGSSLPTILLIITSLGLVMGGITLNYRGSENE